MKKVVPRRFSILFVILLAQTCFSMKTIENPSTSVSTRYDDTSNTRDNENSKIQYPSLELIKRKVKGGFKLRTGSKPKLSFGSELIYVCPAETDHQLNDLEKYFSQFINCLYIKQKSKTVLNSVLCENEIEPYLWRYQQYDLACGNDEEGSRYTYAYEICWESKSWIYRYITNKKENRNIRSMKRDWVEIYSICLSSKQPIYVKYRLSVPTQETTPRNHDNRITDDLTKLLPLKTRGTADSELNFEDQSNLYEKYKTINYGQQFGGEDTDDTIIPRMLIPPKHLKPEFSKNALYNYVNVNPMWSSLKAKWERVDEFIRKLGQSIISKSTTVIYAGTADALKINDKDFLMKKEDNDRIKLKVSSIWWKLLINGKKSIILAMQNIPNGYKQTTKKLCEVSICNTHGWDDVNEPNDETIYCCPFTEEMKIRLSLTVESIPISGVFSLHD